MFSGHLNDVYPQKTWLTVVYNAESSVHFSAHLCQPGNCVQMMNFLDRYNLLAIGVSGDPNTKLLASTTWLTQLQSQPMNDAYTQMYTLMQGFCFSAVFSLIGDHAAAWSLPALTTYHRLVSLNQGKNQVLVVATAQDSMC